jgi:cell division protein FtsL
LSMAIISGSGVLKVTVLWVAVIASAVAITYFSHLCREQYTQLTALQREANELQVQYGRYLLEQSAWGSLQRVESMAVSKLGMRTPKVDEIVMVK